MAKTKLEVKNVQISFWTNNGYVHAVRDVSFDLEEGKTLAIVGESGSGKSVTARAMLGILAGNAIVEDGEMYYDGKDLLRIPEEVFHHIRGNNIAMIFQDPLSSLNPIVRVGKQLTEAMIANSVAARKQSKKSYHSLTKAVQQNMILAGQDAGVVKHFMSKFNSFVKEANQLERTYDIAKDTSETNISNIDGVKIQMIDRTPSEVMPSLKTVMQYTKRCTNRFLISEDSEQLKEILEKLTSATKVYKKSAGSDKTELNNALDSLKTILQKGLERPRPVFLAIAYYYVKNGKDSLENKEINSLNEEAIKLFRAEFIDEFKSMLASAIGYSNKEASGNKEIAIKKIDETLDKLSGSVDIEAAEKVVNELKPYVDKAIDKLDLDKNSLSYTFSSSIDNAIFIYKMKQKAEKMSENKKAKLVKKYKLPIDVDLSRLSEGIRLILEKLRESFVDRLKVDANIDTKERATQVVNFLAEEASRMNYRMKYSLAKARAIDLMNEVGIKQPRQRFYQYPFELSGGMRQRIVIAIALASNPDILICDEPTTALDVTIQAQILELINNLKRERNLSIIFITHDLGVVANMADRIAVMYAGKIVEIGDVDEVFYEPAHPYTWALLSSMPDLETKEKLESIPGVPPNMIFPPKGDAFAQRNKYAMAIDFEEQPPMFEITPTHSAATWLLHPDAPKVEPPVVVTDRIRRMKEKMEVENGEQ